MKLKSVMFASLLAGVSMTAFAGSDKSFGDVDKDGDKNLSQYELQEAGMDAEVSNLDQDNDGVVGEDEFKQHKESKQKSGSSGQDSMSGQSGQDSDQAQDQNQSNQ